MFESVTELVNLTPHEVNIWMKGEKTTFRVVDIPPSGNVARLHMVSKNCGKVLGIPVVSSVGRKIVGLPAPKKGVAYIVSSVIAREVKRPDVLAPDTTDDGVIRDGAGNIMAVSRFQLFCEDTEVL
jgi:hypothetical protein